MIKSFAARAIIPVALTITGFVVFGCAVLYSFIRADFVEEARRQQRDLADTVLLSMRHAMVTSQRDDLNLMIADIGRRPEVVHLRIFSARRKTFTFSSEPSEVGVPVDRVRQGCVHCHPGGAGATDPGLMTDATCSFRDAWGRPVMAMMVPIFNTPDCQEGSCHVHTASDTVLGALDLGLAQDRLDANLSRLLLQMGVFCLMILVLSVFGVNALLWRNVFLPMKELVDFSEASTHASGGPALAKDEDEMEMVMRNVQEMAACCQEAKAAAEEAKAGQEREKRGKTEEKPGP
jgi:hypothetical protein